MRLLYSPFAILAGLFARLIGRSVFRTVWARIDDEPPPTPGTGEYSMAKVVGARALQSSVMAGSAAAVEIVFARMFHHLFGAWPKKPPKPED